MVDIAGMALRVAAWRFRSIPNETSRATLTHDGEETIELALALADYEFAERNFGAFHPETSALRADLATEIADRLICLLLVTHNSLIDIEPVFNEIMTRNETSEWLELSPGRYRRVKGTASDGR